MCNTLSFNAAGVTILGKAPLRQTRLLMRADEALAVLKASTKLTFSLFDKAPFFRSAGALGGEALLLRGTGTLNEKASLLRSAADAGDARILLGLADSLLLEQEGLLALTCDDCRAEAGLSFATLMSELTNGGCGVKGKFRLHESWAVVRVNARMASVLLKAEGFEKCELTHLLAVAGIFSTTGEGSIRDPSIWIEPAGVGALRPR